MRGSARRQTRRTPAVTRVLEPVPELSPAQQIDAALERHTTPGAALPPARGPYPEGGPSRQSLAALVQQDPRFAAINAALELHAPGRPQPVQEPARRALEAAAREPRFTPAPPVPHPPARSPIGPVRITGELPLFTEALQARAELADPGHDALPSLLWCAGCGRDFTDSATAGYDRVLQFLHIRAAETGWRRDACGLLRCPQCQQAQWVAAWCAPVLAGGVRAELALRQSVEGALPERRREFMPPGEFTFDGLPADAVKVSYDDEGAHVKVDWEAVFARPQRPGGSQGGRHAKDPGPVVTRESTARETAGGAA